MTITADTTPTDSPMDWRGEPRQSLVITPPAPGQADAGVTAATDATGAGETMPECPAFPYLPADIQHALADFDARVADGRRPWPPMGTRRSPLRPKRGSQTFFTPTSLRRSRAYLQR